MNSAEGEVSTVAGRLGVRDDVVWRPRYESISALHRYVTQMDLATRRQYFGVLKQAGRHLDPGGFLPAFGLFVGEIAVHLTLNSKHNS